MTALASPLDGQRRLYGGMLGLVLLFWGLGVGPLAHAVLAHGEPVLHQGGDRGWVGHSDGGRHEPLPRGAPPAHHHAPGALEHLQLAIAAAAVCLTVVAILVARPLAQANAWRSPARPRWRLPAVPGAP